MPNTREKLIELIGSTEYGNSSLIGNNFQKGFIEKIADHLIANGVTVQKWISVKDWLPEDDLPEGSKKKTIKVLVAIKADNGIYTIRSQTRCKHPYYHPNTWEWGKFTHGTITHWMPLPEPPKEVQ